jgi:ribosomal-protein-alanine N-acetyltransferase
MFPQLETSRLLLTDIRSADAADVFALFSNPRVVEYYDLSVFTEPSEAEQLIQRWQARYESGLGIRWAIRPKSSNKLIGTCGFNSWQPPMRSATIGYDLNEQSWGQGFVSEALTKMIDYGFSGRLPCGALHRIQADTVPGNVRSETVLLRIGFQEEGLRRESGYWKNAFHDLKCYGLLEREFESSARRRIVPGS